MKLLLPPYYLAFSQNRKSVVCPLLRDETAKAWSVPYYALLCYYVVPYYVALLREGGLALSVPYSVFAKYGALSPASARGNC